LKPPSESCSRGVVLLFYTLLDKGMDVVEPTEINVKYPRDLAGDGLGLA